MKDTKFSIFVPADVEGRAIKSADGTTDTDEQDWYVKGYASTPDLDLQGDIVRPTALNIDYFVKHGWINWEHSQEEDHIIGEPTDNCFIDPERGLFVEAKLLKGREKTEKVWNLAKDLVKNNSKRRLGFSIEGVVRKRNDEDARYLEDVFIKNVALTTHPANPNATWEAFVKNWDVGHETNPAEQVDASALQREDLVRAITTLTQAIDTLSVKELDDAWLDTARFLDQSDKSSDTIPILLLQLSKGLSREAAHKYINNTNTD